MISYPPAFKAIKNFELAWERIVRSGDRNYKGFFSHLYPSYQFAARTNLDDLISAIRAGTYRPSSATRVYFPKSSGILRPITLLSLSDQVTYQAIVNVIANRFYGSLRPLYYRRSFGALYDGGSSKFFFRRWKTSYRAFNKAIIKAHSQGNTIVADFDLVAFYDLIDHSVLRKILEHRIRSGELLDLLDQCLKAWTSGESQGITKGHGIPQGPDASAFLAEVVLNYLDRQDYGNVVYLR